MGVLCRFSQYDENFDILGAVFLQQYFSNRGNTPDKRTLRRVRSQSLNSIINPTTAKFTGKTLLNLKNAMDHFNIGFELYFDGKIILTNVNENVPSVLQLVSSSKKECEKLTVLLKSLQTF